MRKLLLALVPLLLLSGCGSSVDYVPQLIVQWVDLGNGMEVQCISLPDTRGGLSCNWNNMRPNNPPQVFPHD